METMRCVERVESKEIYTITLCRRAGGHTNQAPPLVRFVRALSCTALLWMADAFPAIPRSDAERAARPWWPSVFWQS